MLSNTAAFVFAFAAAATVATASPLATSSPTATAAAATLERRSYGGHSRRHHHDRHGYLERRSLDGNVEESAELERRGYSSDDMNYHRRPRAVLHRQTHFHPHTTSHVDIVRRSVNDEAGDAAAKLERRSYGGHSRRHHHDRHGYLERRSLDTAEAGDAAAKLERRSYGGHSRRHHHDRHGYLERRSLDGNVDESAELERRGYSSDEDMRFGGGFNNRNGFNSHNGGIGGHNGGFGHSPVPWNIHNGGNTRHWDESGAVEEAGAADEAGEATASRLERRSYGSRSRRHGRHGGAW